MIYTTRTLTFKHLYPFQYDSPNYRLYKPKYSVCHDRSTVSHVWCRNLYRTASYCQMRLRVKVSDSLFPRDGSPYDTRFDWSSDDPCRKLAHVGSRSDIKLCPVSRHYVYIFIATHVTRHYPWPGLNMCMHFNTTGPIFVVHDVGYSNRVYSQLSAI